MTLTRRDSLKLMVSSSVKTVELAIQPLPFFCPRQLIADEGKQIVVATSPKAFHKFDDQLEPVATLTVERPANSGIFFEDLLIVHEHPGGLAVYSFRDGIICRVHAIEDKARYSERSVAKTSFAPDGKTFWLVDDTVDPIRIQRRESRTGNMLRETSIPAWRGSVGWGCKIIPHPSLDWLVVMQIGDEGCQIHFLQDNSRCIGCIRTELIDDIRNLCFINHGREYLLVNSEGISRYQFPQGAIIGQIKKSYLEFELDFRAPHWAIATRYEKPFVIDLRTMTESDFTPDDVLDRDDRFGGSENLVETSRQIFISRIIPPKGILQRFKTSRYELTVNKSDQL